ncbi:hypothetical protein Dimus_005518 [Dionaea muscipula]
MDPSRARPTVLPGYHSLNSAILAHGGGKLGNDACLWREELGLMGARPSMELGYARAPLLPMLFKLKGREELGPLAGSSAFWLLSLSSAMPRPYHGGNSVNPYAWSVPCYDRPLPRSFYDRPFPFFGHGLGNGYAAYVEQYLVAGVMSPPSRVTIHPSLLEMTPLRIPSPASDSPEFSCQGSEESSFSGDESCPPCELGEGDALCMSSKGVIPYALEEGANSRGRPELELSSSSFLSIGGGGSDRFHGPNDDDVRSYVGSEEAGLRTPPLQDLIGIPSLDEMGVAL